MKIEVYSKESNALNWVIAGLKRRVSDLKDIDEDTCKEVANELKLDFEQKQDGNYSFKDRQ